MKNAIGRLPLLLLWFSLPLFSQNDKIYTVQVGTFLDAKSSEFENIRSLGMVYGQRVENNLYRVYIGGFDKAAPAQALADQVKRKGYNSAAVVEIPILEGRTVTVIQFETLNAKRAIDWNKYQSFDNLFAIIHEDVVKLVTGPYAGVDEARKELDKVKKAGYADAFIKRVNTAFLQRITTFETGIKQPLIPLNLTEAPPPAPAAAPETVPQSYNAPSPNNYAARGVTTGNKPEIRANIRRRSALELQKVLKSAGAYQDALDGLYGPGTERAYQAVLRTNRDLQKYQILAQSMSLPLNQGPNDAVQGAIDNLLTDPQASTTLERSPLPVAKAYRAYFLFSRLGPSNEVNALMNTAIQQAYTGKALKGKAPFNYSATYAYNDLDQLILHMLYIHMGPGNAYAVPCWLFQRHPQQATQAMSRALSSENSGLTLQSCDPFLTWEEARLACVIAMDLNGGQRAAAPAAGSERTRLYLATQPLNSQQTADIMAWEDKVWGGLNRWAAADPLHQRLVDAFKIAYFQTQVRLEDYFMDRSFSSEEAKALALATLKTMVGGHLERFQG